MLWIPKGHPALNLSGIQYTFKTKIWFGQYNQCILKFVVDGKLKHVMIEFATKSESWKLASKPFIDYKIAF